MPGAGLAVIVITHELGVIAATARRLLVIYAGRLAEAGPTSRLLASPRHPYTRGLLDALPRPKGRVPLVPIGGRTSLHLLTGLRPDDYVLQHWSGNPFAFYPTGESALGITAATFNADASSTRAKSVTLEYYNTTGLGRFTRP